MTKKKVFIYLLHRWRLSGLENVLQGRCDTCRSGGSTLTVLHGPKPVTHLLRSGCWGWSPSNRTDAMFPMRWRCWPASPWSSHLDGVFGGKPCSRVDLLPWRTVRSWVRRSSWEVMGFVSMVVVLGWRSRSASFLSPWSLLLLRRRWRRSFEVLKRVIATVNSTLKWNIKLFWIRTY